MQLNDYQAFSCVDRENMLAHIDALPQQFTKGWELGHEFALPNYSPQRVILAGVGGAAMAGDLLAAYLAPRCGIPIYVHHDYDLPAWAASGNTFVIAISHLGVSEEAVSALRLAKERACYGLAITTGGHLAELAALSGLACCRYSHPGPSRTAAGLVYGILLSIFDRLNIAVTSQKDFASVVEAMQRQQVNLKADVPLARNPAKRLAGQFLERWVTIFAAGHLSPVARRWKTQTNELAKALASFEVIPEADYNALMGFNNPPEEIPHGMAFFLQSGLYHPQNHARIDVTRKTLMLEGINTDFYVPPAETALGQQCCALHFGDYLAYFLAMLYEIDPTPVELLDSIALELSA